MHHSSNESYKMVKMKKTRKLLVLIETMLKSLKFHSTLKLRKWSIPFELGIMSGFFSSESFTSTRYSVLVALRGGGCLVSGLNFKAKTIPSATTRSPQTTPTQTPRIGVSSKSTGDAGLKKNIFTIN